MTRNTIWDLTALGSMPHAESRLRHQPQCSLDPRRLYRLGHRLIVCYFLETFSFRPLFALHTCTIIQPGNLTVHHPGNARPAGPNHSSEHFSLSRLTDAYTSALSRRSSSQVSHSNPQRPLADLAMTMSRFIGTKGPIQPESNYPAICQSSLPASSGMML